MKKLAIKSFSAFLLAVLASLALTAQGYCAGTPAGAIMMDDSGNMTVIGFNFDSSFTKQEVDDVFETASSLVSLIQGSSELELFSPDDLMGYGLDGDSLHSLLVSNLSSFDTYIQISVSKLSSAIHRFNAFEWHPGDSQGAYIGSLELPKSLPLMSLLNFLNPGTNCIKVITTESSNSYGNIVRWDFYAQQNCTGTGDFIAALEVSENLLQ